MGIILWAWKRKKHNNDQGQHYIYTTPADYVLEEFIDWYHVCYENIIGTAIYAGTMGAMEVTVLTKKISWEWWGYATTAKHRI